MYKILIVLQCAPSLLAVIGMLVVAAVCSDKHILVSSR
jgi:hypothetical protein